MSRSKASLHELTVHFKVSREVLLPMMEVWINKGKIRRCEKESHCGIKCLQCKPSTVEWFEWVSDSTKVKKKEVD